MQAIASRRTIPAGLKAREFLFLAEEIAGRQIPAALRPPQRAVMWTILQLHYGDAKLHFELQPQPGRSQVEVGLHFESSPERNEALAIEVANHPEFHAALGPGWELEEWTASWRRLHIAIPAETLTHELAETAAAELAAVVIATGQWLREVTHRG